MNSPWPVPRQGLEDPLGLRIVDCELRIDGARNILGLWMRRHSKKRTKVFGLRIIRLVHSLPKSRTTDVIGRQLLRCGTSVGANYRAACRAKSPAEFAAKMGIVEEECDETIYWMELLVEADLIREPRVADLMSEANEILAMVIASIRTSRRRKSSAICNPQSIDGVTGARRPASGPPLSRLGWCFACPAAWPRID